jgi:hypothetical protein
MTSPPAELERLARTIARWETPIVRWHRTRLTNAATEGANLIVKNIEGLGYRFRSFENYRLRLLLRCGKPWHHPPVASTRPATTHQQGADPVQAAPELAVGGSEVDLDGSGGDKQ